MRLNVSTVFLSIPSLEFPQSSAETAVHMLVLSYVISHIFPIEVEMEALKESIEELGLATRGCVAV